jgi:hypothetical protein
MRRQTDLDGTLLRGVLNGKPCGKSQAAGYVDSRQQLGGGLY